MFQGQKNVYSCFPRGCVFVISEKIYSELHYCYMSKKMKYLLQFEIVY